MYDGETLHPLVFPYLIEGYKEVASLPPDYELKVYLSSLLVAVRTLARRLRKKADTMGRRGDTAHLSLILITKKGLSLKALLYLSLAGIRCR